MGRAVIVVITILAIALVRVGDQNKDFKPLQMIVDMGLVAIAFSSQLIPATFDMLFFRKASRTGIISGMVAGLAAVLLFTPLTSMMLGLAEVYLRARRADSVWR